MNRSIQYKTLLTAGLVIGLQACAMFEEERRPARTQQLASQPQAVQQICVSHVGQVVDCNQGQMVTQQTFDDIQMPPISHSHPLVASNNSVLLGEYVEQMATHMLESLSVPVESTVVGVTSFVEFTDNLSSINQLGNMLAESFIFELQQNGIPVIDYKVAGTVTVQTDGDYVFSRNTEELNVTDTMQYVLTGTMMYNKRGLVVNARIVNFMNKRVVASSKKVIPYFVLDSIIPVSEKQAIIGS